jgi:hypothetical protein
VEVEDEEGWMRGGDEDGGVGAFGRPDGEEELDLEHVVHRARAVPSPSFKGVV